MVWVVFGSGHYETVMYAWAKTRRLKSMHKMVHCFSRAFLGKAHLVVAHPYVHQSSFLFLLEPKSRPRPSLSALLARRAKDRRPLLSYASAAASLATQRWLRAGEGRQSFTLLLRRGGASNCKAPQQLARSFRDLGRNLNDAWGGT